MAASPNIVSHGDAMKFTQSEATAAQRTWCFYLSNAADGTPATGKTIATTDFKISKNGAAFANAVGVVTEMSLGWYKMVFDPGDLDTIGALACELSGEAGVDTLHVTHQVTLFDHNVALTPALIAAAILDLAISGHTTDGTVGEALSYVEATKTAVAGLTSGRTKTRSIAMAAASTGRLVFDQADTGVGYDVSQASSGKVTVTGTWNGATATLQTCADPTITVPVWTTHGTPITADGDITITAPVKAIRLVTSGGGGSTALAATALVVEPK